MGRPAPERYADAAKPIPRPGGSCRDFSRHPDAATTRSMHSRRPEVVIVRWLTVLLWGGTAWRWRISAGSRPGLSAIRSRWASRGKRGWGGPRAGLGPQGVLVRCE